MPAVLDRVPAGSLADMSECGSGGDKPRGYELNEQHLELFHLEPLKITFRITAPF